MRMLRKLRNRVIGLTILVGASVAFYYVALTPEARQSLRDARLAVTDSYHKMAGSLEGMRGIVMEEDKAYLPNREAVIEQWKSMGF